MFGGYPPTAIGYPPTAIVYTPTTIGYTPTAIGYPPTAIGYTPTTIGYPPTAIGYPPAAIVGRIGDSEFFFFSLRHPLGGAGWGGAVQAGAGRCRAVQAGAGRGGAVSAMPFPQDHKAVGDGDTGPNTGGMGAYLPPPVLTEALRERIMTTIVDPTVKGMKADGCPFKGVLFAGLMIMKDGSPMLLEYNVRFGDPETQVWRVEVQQSHAVARAEVFWGGVWGAGVERVCGGGFGARTQCVRCAPTLYP